MKRTKLNREVSSATHNFIKQIDNLIIKIDLVEDQRDLSVHEKNLKDVLEVIHDIIVNSELITKDPDSYYIMPDFMIDLDNEEFRGKKVFRYRVSNFKFVKELWEMIKKKNGNLETNFN